MQQDISHNPIQLFKQVLTSQETLTEVHNQALQTLLYSFPQSGLLHAIQARSGNTAQLNEAAAWFSDNAALQKIVQHPNSLPAVNPAQIIFKPFFEPLAIPEPAAIDNKPDNAETEAYFEIIDDNEAQPTVIVNVDQPNNQATLAQDEPQKPALNHDGFDETQKLIIENIASNDYFVFDRAFIERDTHNEPPASHNNDTVAARAQEQEQTPPDEGQVTRYHDDTMPYSFMWWLDKTRSKHSGIYRPFAAPGIPAASKKPLPATPPSITENRQKEENLVERFIQEEPQIKPPSSDKLDNENKARQSAEDQEELITETLARIYADQMLYSKAIAAYKILMLKNPEKRRYFASQIEILEKKIN